MDSSATLLGDSQEIFFDADGLIVHRGGDGGDTAQREGWYWLGVWIRENVFSESQPEPRQLSFPGVLRLLEPASDGVFYRHPKLAPWNNPYDKTFGFSRDQMVPLVAAMGVWGYTEPLRRLWNKLPQDVVGGTKHTFNGEWQTVLGQRTVHTGDIVGPATINLFRRAWSEDPMVANDNNGPAGEAELLVNVNLRLRAATQDRDDTGDDLNLIVLLLMSLIKFGSSISAEAVQQYKSRAHSYGSYLDSYRREFGVDMGASRHEVERRFKKGILEGWKTNGSAIFGAARWYHRPEVGANPRLATLYDPVIKKYWE